MKKYLKSFAAAWVVAGWCGVAVGQGGVSALEVRHADDRGTPSFKPVASGPTAGDAAAARAALQNLAGEFGLPATLDGLELASRKESLLGVHYRFQQKIGGVPVEGADVVVSLRRSDGSVYQVANNFHPVKVQPTAHGRARAADAALDAAWAHLRVHGKLTARTRVELLYVPQGNGSFRLIHRTLIATEAPFGRWEHRFDAESGELLSVKDAVMHRVKCAHEVPDFAAYKGAVRLRAEAEAEFDVANPQVQAVTPPGLLAVTNGSGRVFDPDPRTTLNNGTLTNASAAALFTNAYFTRPLLSIQVNGGVYSLTGAWVRIVNFEAPVTQPSTTTSGSWTNSRGVNAFNDAMTYFHIDQNQRYLQSLGYAGASGIQQLSIVVDTDGDNGADNSYYDPNNNRLAFGHGGVDDNEDADVILHEYGHAITYDIIPGWTGGDTGGIGEGFGDYWGGAYSYEQTNGSVFNPNWAFTWDGHSTDTWAGRVMNMTNITYNHATFYTAHMTVSGIVNYSDQLWSAPLFQSFLALRGMGIPREQIDTIVIESFFGVSSSPKMRDLAAATVVAAAELYPSGPHANVFFQKFSNQQILTSFPLLTPTIINPLSGEIFRTNQAVIVRWDRRGVGSNVLARIEQNSGIFGSQIYSDNIESGTNGWTRAKTTGTRDWFTQTAIHQSPTTAWKATNSHAASAMTVASPDILLTNTPGFIPTLYFRHRFQTELGYDGGVVEISTNSGTTWSDIGTNATFNGYNGSIDAGAGTTLSGRFAYTGDAGTNFYLTEIPLAAYTGKTINIRFHFASDTSDGLNGWYVDDITLVQGPGWQLITNTTTNVAAAVWVTPAAPGSNHQLRIRQFLGSENSAWAYSAPLIISPDTDGDGLPDAWETKYFTNTTFATGSTDRDGDGASDLAEFYAGTLPNDPASVLRLTALQQLGPTNILHWQSVSNRAYTIEFAPHITNAAWSPLGPETLGIPPLNVITDVPPAVTTRYYRIRAQ